MIGIIITVMGTAVLAITASAPNVLLVAASCFIVGLGLVATPSLIAAQSSVDWNECGVVTGTNLFARSIGSSIGVAVFGAVAKAIYAGTPGGNTDPHTVVSGSGAVFLAILAAAVITVVAVIAMPATDDKTTTRSTADPVVAAEAGTASSQG